jgi:hypothetical protein
MARRQGPRRDQRKPGRLPDPAHRPDHGHHDRPRERQGRRRPGQPGHRRHRQPVHRPVRHGLGHHARLPEHRDLEEHLAGSGGPSIAEALFATAIGLVAAIPAYIAYNKFSTDAGKYAGRLEGFADDLSTAIQRRLAEKV